MTIRPPVLRKETLSHLDGMKPLLPESCLTRIFSTCAAAHLEHMKGASKRKNMRANHLTQKLLLSILLVQQMAGHVDRWHEQYVHALMMIF